MSGLFKNILESFKRLFGDNSNDPEQIMAKCLEDVKKKLPEMNILISRARNEMIMFSQQIRHLKQEYSSVKKQFERASSEVAAFEIKARLNDLEHRITSKEELHKNSDENYNRMVRIKSIFEAELRRRILKATTLLERARANEWKDRFATISEDFNVISDTLDANTEIID